MKIKLQMTENKTNPKESATAMTVVRSQITTKMAAASVKGSKVATHLYDIYTQSGY